MNEKCNKEELDKEELDKMEQGESYRRAFDKGYQQEIAKFRALGLREFTVRVPVYWVCSVSAPSKEAAVAFAEKFAEEGHFRKNVEPDWYGTEVEEGADDSSVHVNDDGKPIGNGTNGVWDVAHAAAKGDP